MTTSPPVAPASTTPPIRVRELHPPNKTRPTVKITNATSFMLGPPAFSCRHQPKRYRGALAETDHPPRRSNRNMATTKRPFAPTYRPAPPRNFFGSTKPMRQASIAIRRCANIRPHMIRAAFHPAAPPCSRAERRVSAGSAGPPVDMPQRIALAVCLCLCCLYLLATPNTAAADTRTFRQSTAKDFQEGEVTGASILP